MKSQAYPINKTTFFIQNDIVARFLFVLWGKREKTAPGKECRPFVFLHASGQIGPGSGLPVFVIVRRFFHGAEVKHFVQLYKNLPNVL